MKLPLPLTLTMAEMLSIPPANIYHHGDPTRIEDEDEPGGIPNLPMLTLREIEMLKFMNKITDRLDWQGQIFLDPIAAKWKAEAITNEGFSEKMASYCIEELRFKAEQFQQNGCISVYNGDVVKSDAAPESLKFEMQKGVTPLEDIPSTERDWCPGLNGTTVNLVDPSLFPLVSGLTRILKNGHETTLDNCVELCGLGEVVEMPNTEVVRFNKIGPLLDRTLATLPYHQWLPCEVDISGDFARITSYINNIHPQRHKGLYHAINQVITYAIPMWSATLWPQNMVGMWPSRIGYYLDDMRSQEFAEINKLYLGQRSWHGDEDSRPRVIQPEPGDFKPSRPAVISSLKDRHKTLQVMVKLTNVELTPDKASFPCDWILEGQDSECICATALYVYSCNNTTSFQISFSQSGDHSTLDSFKYNNQNIWDWLIDVFGLDIENVSPDQLVGGVEIREGRMITFPSFLPLHIPSFTLADPTLSGHVKMLYLYLVDPNVKVTSTAQVPCQQRSWWKDAIMDVEAMQRKLPLELQDSILDLGSIDSGFPIGIEEAKKNRLNVDRKTILTDKFHNFSSALNLHCD